METFLGPLLGLVVGILLGLLGGGGAILTVPIFHSLYKMDMKASVVAALLVVGPGALIGFFQAYKKKTVELKVAWTFALISMVGAFIGAKVAIYLSDAIQLYIFGIVVLVAALYMLLGKRPETPGKRSIFIVSLVALGVGGLTGIIGVGGGFLIVPALILFLGMEPKRAVGASLFVIALNSFSALLGHWGHIEMDLQIFFPFFGAVLLGIFLGNQLLGKISSALLTKSFAIFLLLVGGYVLLSNLKGGS